MYVFFSLKMNLLLLFFLCFFNIRSTAQNEFIDLVNSRISNLKREVYSENEKNEKLKKLITSLQVEARVSKSKERLLQDKLKELYLVESELIKKGAELARLSNDLKLMKNNNNNLIDQIKELNDIGEILSANNKANKEYISELEKKLRDSDQQLLNEQAKNDALVKTIRNYDKKNRDLFSDLLFFLDVGGRRKTFSFHGLLGIARGRRENIFIGIGAGYDDYDREDINMAIIPLYASFRWILNKSGFEYIIDDSGSFTMREKDTPYFITEAGYAVSLKEKSNDFLVSNSTFNSSSLLFNVGFGYMRSIDPFINLNITATYKRQRFLQLDGANTIVNASDDSGVRFSIGILINPK